MMTTMAFVSILHRVESHMAVSDKWVWSRYRVKLHPHLQASCVTDTRTSHVANRRVELAWLISRDASLYHLLARTTRVGVFWPSLVRGHPPQSSSEQVFIFFDHPAQTTRLLCGGCPRTTDGHEDTHMAHVQVERLSLMSCGPTKLYRIPWSHLNIISHVHRAYDYWGSFGVF